MDWLNRQSGLAGKIRKLLAKAADAALKELAVKDPPRGLAIAPAARQQAQGRSPARRTAGRGKRLDIPPGGSGGRPRRNGVCLDVLVIGSPCSCLEQNGMLLL